MTSTLKRGVKSALRKLGLNVMSDEALQMILAERDKACQQKMQGTADERDFAQHDLAMLLALMDTGPADLQRAFRESKSQLKQDIFALSELGFKRNGFFVEFGATDGDELSNTNLLEKQFGWTGILAEPARNWHADLRRNRNCIIETDCVWTETGSTLTFNEADVGWASTIDSFSDGDMHSETRQHGRKYDVRTISLNDLLDKHNAPATVDFLSIDTEGSEFEILKSFDFEKRRFRVITCEHNFAPQREEVYKLLTSKGYVRKLEELSKFDDWYVLAG